ncbi:hypothetical protein MMC17_007887 [Xylographa soralifera]|nr:hypothetical protein [Xylographa soralifera]
MHSSHLPVLIVGTGPSGLLLAHALKKADIPFELFERDASLNIRGQGYRFKLTGPGVLALQDILEPSHYQILKHSCATNIHGFTNLDALTAVPAQGLSFPKKHDNPEPLCADRTLLRLSLAQGLEDKIRFNHKITNYKLSADGTSVTASFAHGTSITGSLLVAADGGWSRIRQQYLPSFNPVDTEGRFLYGKTPITPELLEKFNPAAMQHMTIISNHTGGVPVSLLLEPMCFDHALAASEGVQLPPDYIYWALGSRIDRFDMSSLGEKPSSEDCAAFAQRIVKEWHPSFQALFQYQDISQITAIRIISMAPPMPLWEASRVTLIGDAAHCLSPTSGVGATIALRDARLLGKILAEKGVSIESVAEYEKEMRAWPELAAQNSVGVGRMIFGMRDFAELKPVARSS